MIRFLSVNELIGCVYIKIFEKIFMYTHPINSFPCHYGSVQIKFFGAGDPHRGEVAQPHIIAFDGHQHLIVHFGRVRFGAADKILALFPVEEHFEGLANFGLVFFAGNFLLHLHQLLGAFGFYLRGHIVGQVVGAGAFFVGILEHADAFEALFTHKIEQFLKIGVCFPGVADEESCSDGDARYFGANGVQEFNGFRFCDLAAHERQHVVGSVLQGHVQIQYDRSLTIQDVR